jgi:GNAT superfamily N-acetyltransferase
MTGVEAATPLRFRRPAEADHARIVELVDEWWGGRRMRALLPRMWFRHFSGTSWIVEDDGGRLLGFLVGFISPDHPDTAYAHMIATNPNRRRRGIGRALYEQFFADGPPALAGSRRSPRRTIESRWSSTCTSGSVPMTDRGRVRSTAWRHIATSTARTRIERS